MSTEQSGRGYKILKPVSEIASENAKKWPDILKALRKLRPGQWLPIESSDPKKLAEMRRDLKSYQAKKIGNVLYVGSDSNPGNTNKLPFSRPDPLNVVEKRAIQHALLWANGSKADAARLLGIAKTTMYRKVREYKI